MEETVVFINCDERFAHVLINSTYGADASVVVQ